MPLYTIPAHEIDVHRQAVIVDTNVLFSAFLPGEQRHADATTFLELLLDSTAQIIIPLVVVVETWGMLVGSRKCPECGYKFLNWLADPGNPLVIVHDRSLEGRGREVTSEYNVDFVDATLFSLASEICERCNIEPAVRVATYDTRDFYRCSASGAFRMRYLDPESLEEY